MLYLVGLGLGDAKDITVKGLEIVKSAKVVYLEAYTSILTVGKEELEEYYGREVIIADRDLVEQGSDSILSDALDDDVAFLAVGDPFGATTHTDLVLRAVEKNIPYRVIHNASIMNAVGCCGLQLYNFGETVSLVFWTDSWKPLSFYDKIKANRERGLHTLCLLDIKIKEQTVENMMKKNKIYEPPKFMSASLAAEQLLQTLKILKEDSGVDDLAYSKETICVGLARIGSDSQEIVVMSLKKMAHHDLGEPLHSLIIPGKVHPLEADMLRLFTTEWMWFEEAIAKCL